MGPRLRRWRPLFSFLCVNGVSVAANHPASPCQCHDPTVANLKLHWISSHWEETMLRGFQATWTLMTQGPLIVNGDPVSGTIDQGSGSSFKCYRLFILTFSMKRGEGNRERERFLCNSTPLSLCFSIFYTPLHPPPPCFILSLSPAASPSPLPTVVFKARPKE